MVQNVAGDEAQHEAESAGYDRKAEIKAFDDTKGGVKGLVDARIIRVPRIFIGRTENAYPTTTQYQFPIIDLNGIGEDPAKRKQVVREVADAYGTWGFFQVINHEIPVEVLQEMLNVIRRFFEQDAEVKKQWYSRGHTRRAYWNCNFDLYSAPVTDWRETMNFAMLLDFPSPEKLPSVCSDEFGNYPVRVIIRGSRASFGLSERCGLPERNILGHCYLACPEPELTLGASKHEDNDFITVLLQDHTGGFQVLYKNHGVDVPPTPGALVVNTDDLIQLMSNNKFISAQHRVLANRV